jgi:hypothetical protein
MPAKKETTTKSTEAKATKKDSYKLKGEEIVSKVKEIIKEGNARRIIIKNEEGKSVMELPVTVGVVSVLVAPYLAAVGALAAVLTNCTVEVERE